MKKILLLLLAVPAFLLFQQCKKEDEYKDLSCNSPVSYTSTIKTIIDANCTSSGCHNANSRNGDLTSYAGVLVQVRNGELSKRVLYKKNMPRSRPLSLEDRQKIKCWLDGGSPEN